VVVLRPPARSADSDWPGLFRSAFRKSRNAMALVDHSRVLVDVNGAFLRIVGHCATR
jgi:PAS domain S-box-containing protein